jgi:hypothetical protein
MERVQHDAHARDLFVRGSRDQEDLSFGDDVAREPAERRVAIDDEARQDRDSHAGAKGLDDRAHVVAAKHDATLARGALEPAPACRARRPVGVAHDVMAIAQTSPGHWLPWGRFRDTLRTGERQTLATLGMEIFEHYAKAPAEAPRSRAR